MPSEWGWSFSATWGSETPEPIHLKSGMFDYVNSPTTHAKYGGRRKWVGGGHMGEVVPSRAFFNFFSPRAKFHTTSCVMARRIVSWLLAATVSFFLGRSGLFSSFTGCTGRRIAGKTAMT